MPLIKLVRVQVPLVIRGIPVRVRGNGRSMARPIQATADLKHLNARNSAVFYLGSHSVE